MANESAYSHKATSFSLSSVIAYRYRNFSTFAPDRSPQAYKTVHDLPNYKLAYFRPRSLKREKIFLYGGASVGQNINIDVARMALSSGTLIFFGITAVCIWVRKAL